MLKTLRNYNAYVENLILNTAEAHTFIQSRIHLNISMTRTSNVTSHHFIFNDLYIPIRFQFVVERGERLSQTFYNVDFIMFTICPLR